ncbi:tetratricopeptide repeat protein [Actinomadura sp. CNU-125]|uniref:tetratricopeptide repeat protein n=1 Tax=Actinomadura sp. CNU-125 TaxID=1904961 RepID=UPI002916E8F8|nr:tetratricopeptide repeat protein [Actinomadura sp. CNU-125]
MRGCDPGALSAPALLDAGRRLEALRLDTERRAAFTAEVLEAAQAWVRTGGPAPGPSRFGSGRRLLGTRLREPELRARLEETYRLLAKLADGRDVRHAMVRRANAVRPRTLL